MLSQYGFILIFILLGFGFGIMNIFLLSPLLRFRSGDMQQKIAYECGMPPIGSPYIPTDIRFYIFALLFVVFDVESLFIFPWAVVFRELGWYGFISMGVFIGILFFGLIYTWRRGGLKWGTN